MSLTDNPYSPPGEDVAEINHERVRLASHFARCVFWGEVLHWYKRNVCNMNGWTGIALLLYGFAAYKMVSKPPQGRPWKHLLFITIQIVLVSISNGCQLKADIMTFIDNRGFPGGPLAWLESNYPATPLGISTLFGTLSFWMQDGFLVSISPLYCVLVTISPDVPLLLHLWIQSVLPYSSRYSVFSIHLCVLAVLSKSERLD